MATASGWSRRASTLAAKAGVAGSTRGNLSPKGTIKRKKQERKALERRARTMRNLNLQIGRLEDRDTQQQAFAALVEALPTLDASLVTEVYALIEKNKIPARASARRMLVLLIAALCKCHPVPSARILPRILSYLCLRLRDRQTKVTDACVVLVSAIALYVLPCRSVSLSALGQVGTSPRRGPSRSASTDNMEERPTLSDSEKVIRAFEVVAAVLQREANAVGEVATRCLCGLLRPVDFDGVSVPGPEVMLAHATRISAFTKKLLGESVAKLDGSTAFASFSPIFLLLQSACQLAREAFEKASLADLGAEFAPYIGSIFEATEDAFQCGPRDDWVLRKRALELLTLLLDVFALHEASWCSTVEAAKTYFHANLERVRALVLAGRHDPALLVREAAIPAALAFEYLEDQSPKVHGSLRSRPLGASANYDFMPPSPPGYSFASRDRCRSPGMRELNDEVRDDAAALPSFGEETAVRDHWATGTKTVRESRSKEELGFGDLMTGDEALALTQPEVKNDEDRAERTRDNQQSRSADTDQPDNTKTGGGVMASRLPGPLDAGGSRRQSRRPSTRRQSNSSPNSTGLGGDTVRSTTVSAPKHSVQDEEYFGELIMDESALPEDPELDIGEQTESNREQMRGGRTVPQATQRKSSAAFRGDARTASPPNEAVLPVSSVANTAKQMSTLKQFVAKQRAQARSRRMQADAGFRSSGLRSEPSHPTEYSPAFPADRTAHTSDQTLDNALGGKSSDDCKVHDWRPEDGNPDNEAWAPELRCTRAEAALEAARCGEHELDIRLCLLEDDLALLRRTMGIIRSPCMTKLSTAARDALCTALLLLLDGDEDDRIGEDASDNWLALRWLQHWATTMQDDGSHERQQQLELLNPRVARALSQKLSEMATAPSKTALAAGRVLDMLDL